MRKRLIPLLVSALIISVSVNAFAASTVDQSKGITSDTIKKIVDNYVQYRQDSFNIAGNKIAASSKESIVQDSIDNKLVLSDEKKRVNKLQNLQKKLNVKFDTVKTTAEIKNITYDGNNANVSVYEWTFVDYTGDKGLVDTFGYGVDHILKFAINNNTAKLESDSYDEGPLTEMFSSSYVPTNIDTNSNKQQLTDAQKASLNPLTKAKAVSGTNNTNSVASPMTIISIGFNRSTVASYADNWVYHSANGGTTYDSYYNNAAYKNYNSSGGDCANYVAQCISQVVPQIGKSTHSNAYPAWWYENKGTSSTSDDYVPTDWTWTGADYQKYAMASNFGGSKDNPTDSDIKQGDPMYVAWHGGSTWDHAFICVGYNSNGQPIVNSHNNDYYHVYWKYGYSDSKYTVITIPDTLYLDTSMF